MAAGLVSAALVSACAPEQTSPSPGGLFGGAPVASPTPLAHLTYDCSVLTPINSSGREAPLLAIQSFDAGDSQPYHTCLVDWSGRLRGQMDRAMPEVGSPDGHFYATRYPTSAGAEQLVSYTIIDVNGAAVGQVPGVADTNPMWADDSGTLCFISSSAADLSHDSSAILRLSDVKGHDRAVGDVGSIRGPRPLPLPPRTTPVPGSHGPPYTPISSLPVVPHLIACSTTANRALVGDSLTKSVRLYRLSDGALLWQGQYPVVESDRVFGPRFATGFVATHDCHYLAEMPLGNGSASPLKDAATTVVRDLPTGTVVANLPGAVRGFSWDGAQVVLTTYTPHPSAYLLDWRTAKVVSELAFGADAVSPQPDGTAFAVGVPSTRHAFGFDMYLVRADGTATEMARSVFSAAPGFYGY